MNSFRKQCNLKLINLNRYLHRKREEKGSRGWNDERIRVGNSFAWGNTKSLGGIGGIRWATEGDSFLKMQLCWMNLLIHCAENQHFKIRAVKVIRTNGFMTSEIKIKKRHLLFI